MPLLDKIVDHINTTIKSSLTTKQLQNNRLMGIATRYLGDTPAEGAPAPVVPFIFDNDGNGRSVEFDETVNVSAYHRIITNQYQDDPNGVRGDDKGRVCLSEMVMVVCADRHKLQLSPIFLEAMLESAFPATITKPLLSEIKLYKCNIQLIGSVMDPLQVFATEYSQVPFFIKPHQAYFSIRYKVQSHFYPGCFIDCCN